MHRRTQISILALTWILALSACTSPWKTNTIYSPVSGHEVSLFDVASDLAAGSVVIIAGAASAKTEAQFANRERFLRELSVVGNAPVSVGTDAFDRISQAALDQYLAGNLTEAEFLRSIEWAPTDFARYRPLLLYPRSFRGWAVAIGPNRPLMTKIAKTGLESLGENDRAKLPPGFHRDRTSDFDRYRIQAAKTMDPVTLQNTFDAQAYATDFKAYIIAEFLKLHPEQRLVVYTDDTFAASFNGGLPSRLRARGVPVFVVLQTNLKSLGRAEEDAVIRPDPLRGPRAKYLWIERD